MKKNLLVFLGLFAIGGVAFAASTLIADHTHDSPTHIAEDHSGGTDKNGCHAGSKPYHCH